MATRALEVLITADKSRFDRSMRGMDTTVDRSETRMKRFGAVAGTALKGVGLAAAASAAVGLKKAASAAIEAEVSQRKMVTQLRAAGVSYRQHATEIDRVIQKTSQLSGLDDEDLQDSFTNIVRVTGDVNKSLRLTGLAADFARAKHMDVAKAGELVGKVAGGNIGILSRYGITVDKNATSSQALALLQRKFAGQAAAYGKTTAGSMDRAGVAAENLGEIVGAKFTPLLAKAALAFANLIDRSGKLAGPIRQATGVIRDAYDAVVKAVRRFLNRNREDINAIIETFQKLAKAAKFIFMEVLIPIVKRLLPVIKGVAQGVIQALRGLIRIVTGIVNGDWRQVWEGMKDIPRAAIKIIRSVLDGLWELFKLAIRSVIRGIGRLAPLALEAAKKLGKAVVDGIVAGVKAAPGKIKDAIGNALSSAFGSVKGLIGDGIGKVVGGGLPLGVTGFSGSLMGADQDLAPFAATGAKFGLSVTSGLRPGATTSSGNTSWHASGDAIDMSGPPSGMMAYFRYARRFFGPRLRELIYTPGGVGIKDGRPYQYSGQVARDHFDHVHTAFTGPFGDGLGRKPKTGDGFGSQRDEARRIFEFFRSRGFSNRQAAGWVGNFMQESGLRSGAIQPGGPGRGLAQWGGSRFEALKRFARRLGTSWQSERTQLLFVMHELAGSESAAGRSIRGTDSVRGAVGAITRDYERAGIVGDRLGPAHDALRAFATSARHARRHSEGGGLGSGTPDDRPTVLDRLEAGVALAELTPGFRDDVRASQRLIGYWRRGLRRARHSGDPRRIRDAAQGLQSARESRPEMPEQRLGPGAPLGYEARGARAEVHEARARANDSLKGLLKALREERRIKRRRLRRINKLLRRRLKRSTRLGLLQEKSSLIGELAELGDTIKEFAADQAGGAKTVSRAEELDAGVDTSVNTGGGDTGAGVGGGTTTEADPNVAILAGLMAESVANQKRFIQLVQAEGPALTAALYAGFNGSIGGRVGLGLQGIRSPVGSVANL